MKKLIYKYNWVIFLVALLAIGNLNVKADDSWPREIKTKEARIVIYQPQVESFTGDILESRAAIAVTVKKSDGPVFGAAWFENRVSTDKDSRMVTLEELTVTDIKFPDASDDDIDKLVEILETECSKNCQ